MQRGRSAGSRDVRTVLFTDIVGSTDAAARLGDQAWGDLLARHHAIVRAALRRSHGHEEDTAGDGFFATFARPTEALACAGEIARGVASLDLGVRVGLHAGEVELRDGKASGITVHTAARLMAAATDGEVLTTATVRDLTAGAGWKFDDRGLVELKGLAEPVHAYALDLGVVPAAASQLQAGSATDDHQIRNAGLAGGVLVGVAAALLVVFQVFGGSAPQAASKTAPPSSGFALSGRSASPSAASVASGASPSIDWHPLVFTGAPLAPGSYVANEFLPDMPTLVITDPGWTVSDPRLILARTSRPDDMFGLGYDTGFPGPGDCGYRGPAVEMGSDPEGAFLTWAKSDQALSVTAGRRRKFGDLNTTEYDVVLVPKYACTLTSPITVPMPAGVTLSPGIRTRVEVTSRHDQLLMLWIQAPAADFDAFEPEAETVLGTLDLGP